MHRILFCRGGIIAKIPSPLNRSSCRGVLERDRKGNRSVHRPGSEVGDWRSPDSDETLFSDSVSLAVIMNSKSDRIGAG